MEQYNALYSEALKKGYSVTEDEVDRYLEELRKQLAETANKDDVQSIISSYGDEDEYWKKMKEVYLKRLVVQKYTGDLENAFASEYTGTKGIEKYEKDWEKAFEKIKEEVYG